jgi:hypothetical protein
VLVGVLIPPLSYKSTLQETKRIVILVANGTPERGRWRVDAFDRGLRARGWRPGEREDAKAVVLQLVNPAFAGRHLVCERRLARHDEAGRL